MIFVIAVALLQIRAIPQTSISTISMVTAKTEGATAATDMGTTAVPSDGTETVNSISADDPPKPAGLPSAGLFVRGPIAGPISLPHSQDHSERLRHRDWLALSIAQHSAATFDAWSTRRVISSGQGRELNPMMRPFAGNGSLYVVAQVGPIVFDYLGRRMMTSQCDWSRRTWWIPQVVSTIVLLASGAHNLSVH
jgi:hypothetical protein